MSNEPQQRQTANPPQSAAASSPIARLALLVGLFVVSVPFFMMSVMMMGMGWMGLPMQTQMSSPMVGFIPFVGMLGLLLLVGLWYGTYRVWVAEVA